MTYIYRHAILGGTFDHFHVGHEKFVAAPFSKSRKITIGLVKRPATKLWSSSIESYHDRKLNLQSYLQSQGLLSRATIIPLHDVYGSSLIDPTIDAIYVTESTSAGAALINNKRSELGLSKLVINITPYVIGNDQKIVSSSRIREGLINNQGYSLLNHFLQKRSYLIRPELRPLLETPLGTIVTDTKLIKRVIPTSSLIISVGDIVSVKLREIGYTPKISIIDFRTRRQDIDSSIIKQFFSVLDATLVNLASTINSEFANIFLSAMHSPNTSIIKIKGEEDLLALPALLLAPLGAFVVYGQFEKGMCIVKVTPEIKSLAKSYLDQFI